MAKTNISRKNSYVIMVVVIFICLIVIRLKFFESSSSLAPVSVNKLTVTLKRRISYDNNIVDVGFGNEKGIERINKLEFDWDEWLTAKKYTSIGNIFDKCDNKTQKVIGKVVLIPNSSNGFHIETFINVTMGKTVTGGTSWMEVKFKGLRLYTKEFDLCKVSLKLDNPLNCPFPQGTKYSIQDRSNMPSFIPKGDYAISAVLKDQDKQEIGCVTAAFQTGKS